MLETDIRMVFDEHNEQKNNQKNIPEAQSRTVKAENELILKGKGNRVNDWLPIEAVWYKLTWVYRKSGQ
jgi:hypothetical protein